MPTITTQTTRPPAPGAATKAAPSVLGLGEPGLPFAAMLAGSGEEAGSASLLPRQAIAVPGTTLPLPIEPPLPAPAMLRTADPSPAPIAVGLESPFVLDRLPDTDAVPAAIPPSTAAAAFPTAAAADDEDIEVPPPVIAATMPLPSEPSVIPSPPPLALPPVPAMPATHGAKTSPLPSISVGRQPGGPVRAAPAHVASPQTGRDMQWSAAPALPSPAPAAAAIPAPGAVPTIVAPMPTIVPVVAPNAGSPDQQVALIPVPEIPVASISDDRLAITSAAPSPATPLPVMPALLAGPALQVFGAALAAAAKRDLVDRTAPELGTAGIAGAAPAPLLATGTAAINAAGQPMLDMRQDRWPQAMIAHIEQLRDAADAVDTRIRLIPDALGTIDVAVSRDGDTLNVHFAAEQAATRLMLQDAQPRLAAIAEERGLRLGQTAVDANTAGSTPQQSQRQPQRDAMAAATPRRAAPDDDTDRADDGRLA